jgi:signal transduction histidine kinase
VRGDREKLRQVLINLLVNALDATPRSGRVELHVVALDAQVRIETRDTGAGIAAEHLAQLFDPFFTTKPGGTGLGLSIVQRILEQHGGSIDVASTQGVGTTVTVVLPRAEE